MIEELKNCPIESDVIIKYLPHRYPFLLIDRVVEYDLEQDQPTLTGLKNVTVNEPFFPGHFPEHAVMPGVLIIESMAQACGMLAHISAAAENSAGKLFYLVKVDKARFSSIVKPGDQLVLNVRQLRIMRGMGLYACEARVDGKRVASCEVLSAGRD